MSVERLNDDVETVKKFCYIGNAVNASCGSEMIVMAGTQIRWMRFQYGEILYGRRFLLKMNGRVYKI